MHYFSTLFIISTVAQVSPVGEISDLTKVLYRAGPVSVEQLTSIILLTESPDENTALVTLRKQYPKLFQEHCEQETIPVNPAEWQQVPGQKRKCGPLIQTLVLTNGTRVDISKHQTFRRKLTSEALLWKPLIAG